MGPKYTLQGVDDTGKTGKFARPLNSNILGTATETAKKTPRSNTKGFHRETFVSISSADLPVNKSLGAANSKGKLNKPHGSLNKAYYLMGCSFATHV